MKEADTGAWYWWDILVWISGQCWGPGGHLSLMDCHQMAQLQTRSDPLQLWPAHWLGSDILCSSSMGQQPADSTLGRKANSKNFLSQTSAIPIRNPEDIWIPKICDIKSVHGPHFELWAKMWFLMQKYGLKLKVLNVYCPCNSFSITILMKREACVTFVTLFFLKPSLKGYKV